jgi:2-oxoglutarate ferredoxin oxidoreductase subunit gamma
MQTEVVISGFGGQGALFAGQILAYAAMDAKRVVTWIPSYGPEMRGGTANCTVIVADEEIGSPLVRNPKAVIALNLPSLEKYEPLIVPGGVLVANASLVNRGAMRTDIISVFIPANELAESLGDKRMINMVVLGALLVCLPILPLEAIEKALEDHLPERHKRFLPINRQALRQGAEFAQRELNKNEVFPK